MTPRTLIAAGILILGGVVLAAPGDHFASTPSPVPAALCVTHGAAVTSWYVDASDVAKVGALRGVAAGTRGDWARLRITFLGDADPLVKLSDGSVRRQACLKLRAADGCNLAYACWRVGDVAGPWIQVQVKSNPGKRTAAECGAAGYIVSTPTWKAASIPDYRDGLEHQLEAAVADDLSVSVRIDGTEVWRGALDPIAGAFDGPAGIRTDNAAWTGFLDAVPDCASITGD